MIKTIKKGQKRVLFSRGTYVDATWHLGPRGSATGAHAAPTRHDVTYIFIFIVIIWVIVHISIQYSEFNLTRIFNASYIPDMFL